MLTSPIGTVLRIGSGRFESDGIVTDRDREGGNCWSPLRLFWPTLAQMSGYKYRIGIAIPIAIGQNAFAFFASLHITQIWTSVAVAVVVAVHSLLLLLLPIV